jgi:hypothetical protein
MNKTVAALALGCALVTPARSPAQATGASPAPKAAWIIKSDAHAKLLLDVTARFSPEFAGFVGLEGFDDQVFDLKPKLRERTREANRAVQARLEKLLGEETDPGSADLGS